MCNFIPVRNWLIAVSVIAAAAIWSAILAGILENTLPPPLVWIAAICFAAAASWAAAGVALALLGSKVLDAYCACIAESGKSACAQQCRLAKLAFALIVFFLLGLGAICLIASFMGGKLYVWHLAIAGTGLVAAIGAASWFGGATQSCQRAPV
jgi:hypothetical protein